MQIIRTNLISVCVPFHAGGNTPAKWRETLQRFIHSLAASAQICRKIAERAEVIIVELGSDSTREMVLSQGPLRFRMYSYANQTWNVSTARNVAIRFSSGDYIAVMDADGIVVPPFWDILATLLLENGAENLIVPEYAVITENVAERIISQPGLWRRALAEFLKMSQVNNKHLVMEGSLMATRRDWFERCAGYDENFLGGHFAGTDVDMRVRLYNAGVKDSVLFGYMLAHVGPLSVMRDIESRPLPIGEKRTFWTDEDLQKWRGDTFDISASQPRWGLWSDAAGLSRPDPSGVLFS